jgi:hypothetical protein
MSEPDYEIGLAFRGKEPPLLVIRIDAETLTLDFEQAQEFYRRYIKYLDLMKEFGEQKAR